MVKARGSQAAPDDRASGHQSPDEAGAGVFNGDESHTEVDADDVRVPPVPVGVESIGEAIRSPEVRAIPLIDLADGPAGKLGHEREAGDGASRTDRAVMLALMGSADAVAVGSVAGIQAPYAAAVTGKLLLMAGTEG